jgi:hypothetical protein
VVTVFSPDVATSTIRSDAPAFRDPEWVESKEEEATELFEQGKFPFRVWFTRDTHMPVPIDPAYLKASKTCECEAA